MRIAVNRISNCDSIDCNIIDDKCIKNAIKIKKKIEMKFNVIIDIFHASCFEDRFTLRNDFSKRLK